MSFTMQLSKRASVLRADYFPPITLNADYELVLAGLETFHSIPNITEKNNMFYFNDNMSIEIPTGSYELDDIANYLKLRLEDFEKTVLKANKLGVQQFFLQDLEKLQSISNVTQDNNMLNFNENMFIEIPIGSYKLDEIIKYLKSKLENVEKTLSMTNKMEVENIVLRGNRQTLKSEIICRYSIDFKKPCNIGSLLGFNTIRTIKNV